MNLTEAVRQRDSLSFAQIERVVVDCAVAAGERAAASINGPAYNEAFDAAFATEAERIKTLLMPDPARRAQYDLRARHAALLSDATTGAGGWRADR